MEGAQGVGPGAHMIMPQAAAAIGPPRRTSPPQRKSSASRARPSTRGPGAARDLPARPPGPGCPAVRLAGQSEHEGVGQGASCHAEEHVSFPGVAGGGDRDWQQFDDTERRMGELGVAEQVDDEDDP